MPVDKALNQAPIGLRPEGLLPAPAEAEIEIEIDLGDPVKDEEEEAEDDFSENLVDILDEKQLTQIVSDLLEDYEEDLSRRSDWVQI